MTNNGPVDAVNVRINDQVEPTCTSAAGTFTLAAGASKRGLLAAVCAARLTNGG